MDQDYGFDDENYEHDGRGKHQYRLAVTHFE